MSAFIKTKVKESIVLSIIAYDRFKAAIQGCQEMLVPPEAWDMSSGPNGHLIVEGCDTVKLARDHGTPLYVVNKKRLQKNFLAFYDSFVHQYPHVEVAYSYKTNPLPVVLKILHEAGASAEVISPFELWLALKLGVPPRRIIYNGPGKSEESLDTAISQNIKLINIDGPTEIDIIGRLSEKYNNKQQVGIRVVTSVGWSDQFGFSIKSGAALEAFRKLSEIPGVSPCGLHFHLGTGISEGETYLQAIKEVLDFSMILNANLGIGIRYFDFGGGFGVPAVRSYSRIENMLRTYSLSPRCKRVSTYEPFTEYSTSIIQLFRKYFPQDENCPQIIFEPGRAITSSAQCLLLKVLATKPGRRGNRILILDGGRNIATPTVWEYHHVLAASRMNCRGETPYTIYGPLCHPADLLYASEKLPETGPGDILAIMDAGAYFIPNQTNFSFPRPAAVLVEAGGYKVIRARESFQDIIKLDCLN